MSKGQTTVTTSRIGVAKTVPNGRYRAHMQYKGKQRSKTFDTFEEAVKQREAWEAEKKADKGTSDKICTAHCADCKYMKWFDHYHEVMYCDYYIMKEERRPCCAGDGCTAKVKRAKDHAKRIRKRYSDEFVHSKSFAKAKKTRITKDLIYTENNT